MSAAFNLDLKPCLGNVRGPATSQQVGFSVRCVFGFLFVFFFSGIHHLALPSTSVALISSSHEDVQLFVLVSCRIASAPDNAFRH